ncbi:MAG: hypothetical protein DRO14_06330, partial [Thermoprotei archaeon]
MFPVNEPYPFEEKVKEFLKETSTLPGFEPTGLTRTYYLDLIEPIVRQAVAWQDDKGAIIDPFLQREQDHATARFVGACSVLIGTGRCRDLLEPCLRAMDYACERLYNGEAKTADFYTRELMMGYIFLKKYIGSERLQRWRKWLGTFEPERIYKDVVARKPMSQVYNWNVYTLAGEQMKKHQGLADNTRYIERYIPRHISLFTSYGMYRDPGNPITYDLSARFNFAIMLNYGYEGKYRSIIDELLRRGGLTTLFYLSSKGEAPFGGRSNQYHFVEAMVAALCEYEARRYYQMGNEKLAGAFKRTAHLAALSVRRWLMDVRPFRHIKNFFPPETMHGCDSYGGYSKYSLTTASFFAVAYLFADDGITEQPAPIDVGGYVMVLPDFHKVFATVGDTHIEIDTKADHNYDATGLGRFHRRSVPSELALSSSITCGPKYIVEKPSPRSFTIAPSWLSEEGWCSLAECERSIKGWSVNVLKESKDEVIFRVIYEFSNERVTRITSEYCLREGTLDVTEILEGEISKIRVTIPLLLSDGEHKAEV